MFIYVFICFISLQVSNGFYINLTLKHAHRKIVGDPGASLLLTPYIENMKLHEARKLARTSIPEMENTISYSGYITVDKTCDSNLFFWYIPAKDNVTTNPLVLWLEGGPGLTSLYGAFSISGPYKTTSKGIKLSQHSYTKDHSIVYVDNPVGTGYSYANVLCYSKNENDVAINLYKFLQQFFELFPETVKNPFYVRGNSYGGKYAPAVAYRIHINNKPPNQIINLKGLIISDGWSDPIHQIQNVEQLYQIGLIDTNTKDKEQHNVENIINLIKNKFFLVGAFAQIKRLNHLLKLTGYNYPQNFYYINDTFSESYQNLVDYVQTVEVRKGFHVGDNKFDPENQIVRINLGNDFLQSVAPMMSVLLSHYNVLIYHGQMDMLVSYTGTLKYLNELNFTTAEQYRNAERKIWMMQGDVAGYIKKGGTLTQVLVRNAGHVPALNQPERISLLFTHFTHNKL